MTRGVRSGNGQTANLVRPRPAWLCVLAALPLLSGLAACGQDYAWSLTSDPPQARIEAALPSLLAQIAQIRTYGVALGEDIVRPGDSGFEPLARETLRTAMASQVRFYCTPDRQAVLRRIELGAGLVCDFRSAQDIPTSLPLPGWFGPLRGSEEIQGVIRLYLILEPGQWVEVIACNADATWSCWKSNREIRGLPHWPFTMPPFMPYGR